MARVRKKKHIPQRMEACSAYWFEVPVANRGHWREACGMQPNTPLHVEIGCGKGGFAVQMAQRHPEVCFVAFEKDESVVLAAIEKAAEAGVKNLFFVWTDAVLLSNYFKASEVDRLYINFCDPWTRREKPKRRLTHRDYLSQYMSILAEGGEIFFKTDDPKLFSFSLEELEHAGFSLSNMTMDLHAEDENDDNIRTEFEQKFADQGVPICRVEARREAVSAK